MAKMTISIDGVAIKDIELTKERTTLGRRPYNDIVIDNLAVSGEHAVFAVRNQQVEVEDLNSTNGTYVNGKAVRQEVLQPGDVVEIARYRITFENLAPQGAGGKELDAMLAAYAVPAPSPAAAPSGFAHSSLTPPPFAQTQAAQAPAASSDLVGRILVLNGPAAGREMSLVKVVTTLGKPGVAIAAITRRADSYLLSMVEGHTAPTINGQPLGASPVALRDQDQIELAGTQMRFVLSPQPPS
ncbi:MAG: FHA domain-containing protein [Serpentinimonas sp.]|jgi:pSer/pThr/pTyr-binding forkhead associated (FHA) protein|nr:FHA domain-containing protein [Serpentinimonas sp.]